MKTRVLPREEWGAVEESAGPLLACINRDSAEVVVLENGDGIVASFVVFPAVHVEALTIAEKHRGNAGLGRRLLASVENAVGKWPERIVIAGADSDHMRDVLTRLGAVKVPMDSYLLKGGD